MTTIASRVVRSSPFRDTVQTWEKIVDLLTNGKDSPARAELLSVAGVASAIIAEQAPKDSAIVTTCDGPRTRIYCVYDEEAVDGSSAKEDILGYDPLRGNWAMSLPCPKNDLPWVERLLTEKSNRITARELSITLGEARDSEQEGQPMSVDIEAYFKQ